MERRKVRVSRRWQMRISVVCAATLIGFGIAQCSEARAASSPAWFPWATVTCSPDARLQGGRYVGVYSTETHRIVLWPTVCAEIAYLQTDSRKLSSHKSPNRAAFALFVVAHELSHAGGIADERAADCHAAVIYRGVGRKLRIDRWKVRALRDMLGSAVDLRGCS